MFRGSELRARAQRQGAGHRGKGEGFQRIPQPAERKGKGQKGAGALLVSCGFAILTEFEGPQSGRRCGIGRGGHHREWENRALPLYLPVQG